MKVKRKESDITTPPETVQKAIETVLRELEEGTGEFSILTDNRFWEFEKYQRFNLLHWVDVLDKFDEVLEEAQTKWFITQNEKVKLNTFCGNESNLKLLIGVLRVTELILSNCNLKYIYASVERLMFLVYVDSLQIVEASFRVLVSLHKALNNMSDSQRLPQFISTIIPFCSGWGRTSVPLVQIVSAKYTGELPENFRKIYFEYQEINEENPCQTKKRIINISSSNLTISSYELLCLLVEKYRIPEKYHFPLYHRIRLVMSSSSLESRSQILNIQLLSFVIASQHQNRVDQILSSFSLEPNFLEELLNIASSDDETISCETKLLSLKAYCSTIKPSDRQLFISTFSEGSISLEFLQTSLLNRSISSISTGNYSKPFILELLQIISSISSTNVGSHYLSNLGYFGILFPLVSHYEPSDAKIVAKALGIIEFMMSSNNAVIQSFIDSGGLEIILKRIKYESELCFTFSQTYLKDQLNVKERKKIHQRYSIHHQLLQDLIGILLIAIHSPSIGSGLTGRLIQEFFPQVLLNILTHWQSYGPEIYSLSILAFSDVVQVEPSSYNLIKEVGLLDVVLDSIERLECPLDATLGAYCNALSAICVHNSGVKLVLSRNTLTKILSIFVTPEFAKISSQTFSMLGNCLNELVRHHADLKEPVITGISSIMMRIIEECRETAPKVEYKTAQSHISFSYRQNFCIFIDSFYIGGYVPIPDIEIQKWIESLINFYVLPFGSPPKACLPVSDNNVENAILTLSTSHTGVSFKLIFDLLGYQAKKIETEVQNFCRDSPLPLVTIDFLIGLLIRLAEPSDANRPIALQELASLNSISVCKSLGTIHRILILELSKMEYEEEIEREAKKLASEKAKEEEIKIEENKEGEGDKMAVEKEANNESIIIEEKKEAEEEEEGNFLDKSKLSLLERLIHQISGSLLRAAGYLRDQGPLMKGLAELLSEHFSAKLSIPEGDKGLIIKISYLESMISSLSGLIFDDPENQNAHALLVQTLHQAHGLEALLSNGEMLFSDYTLELRKSSVYAKKTINLALCRYGHFMRALVTSQFLKVPIPGVKSKLPNFQIFIQDVHTIVMRSFLKIWESKFISELPLELIADILVIVNVFIGEDIKVSDVNRIGLSSPFDQIAPAFEPDEFIFGQLLNMGFESHHATEALKQVGNNLEAATDWLLVNIETLPPAESEEDELAKALALSLGSLEQAVQQNEKESKSEESFDDMVNRLKANLFTNLLNLFKIKGIAVSFAKLIANYCKVNEWGVSEVFAQLISKLEDTHKKNQEEEVFNILYCFTILQSINFDMFFAISKSEIVEVIFNLLKDQIDLFAIASAEPKWVVTAFLVLDGLIAYIPNTELKPPKGNTQNCFLTPEQQKVSLEIAILYLKSRKTIESGTIHAILQLCSRATKYYSLAETFLEAGGIEMLFSLSDTCYFNGVTAIVCNILRHLIEDPSTLQMAMEAEIHYYWKQIGARELSPKDFLTIFSHLLNRDREVFFQAVENTCQYNAKSIREKPLDKVGDKNTSVVVDKSSEKSEKSSEKAEKSEKLEKPSKSKANISIDKSRSHHKISKGLISIIEYLIPKLYKINELQKAGEKNDTILDSEMILFLLTDFLTNYSPCSRLLLKAPGSESDQDKFIPFLLNEILPYPIEYLVSPQTSQSQLKTCVNGSKLLASLWTKSSGRKVLVNQISNSLSNFIKLYLEKPVFENLCKIYAIADWIYEIFSISESFFSEISTICLDSKCFERLLESVEILNLDVPESGKVTYSIVNALEILARIITSNKKAEKAQSQAHKSSLGNLNFSHEFSIDQAADDRYHIRFPNITVSDLRNNDRASEDDEDEDDDDDDDDEEEEEEEEPGERNIDVEEEEEDEESISDFSEDERDPWRDDSEEDENDVVNQLVMALRNRVDNNNIFRIRNSVNFRSPYHVGARQETNAVVPHSLLIVRDFPLLGMPYANAQTRGIAPNVVQILRRILGQAASQSFLQRYSRWLSDCGSMTLNSITYAQSFEEKLLETLAAGAILPEVNESSSSGSKLSDKLKEMLDKVEKEKEREDRVVNEATTPTLLSPIHSPRSRSPPLVPPQVSQPPPQSPSQPIPTTPILPSQPGQRPFEVPSSILQTLNDFFSEFAQSQANNNANNVPVVENNNNNNSADNMAIVKEEPSVPENNNDEEFSFSNIIMRSDSKDESMDVSQEEKKEEKEEKEEKQEMSIDKSSELDSTLDSVQEEKKEEDDKEMSVEGEGGEKKGEPKAESLIPDIDPAFLEALPDDIRAEILSNQQTLNNLIPANLSANNPEINVEFLSALPPEMQAEVLEQIRRENQPPSQIPQEMDSASFVATLPDDLREELLLTMDETTLATLPPQLVAEAQVLRERAARMFTRQNRANVGYQYLGQNPFLNAPQRRIYDHRLPEFPANSDAYLPSDPSPEEYNGPVLVSERSLEVLIKLLYLNEQFPHMTTYHKLLHHLSLHHSTRRSLIKIILHILCNGEKTNPVEFSSVEDLQSSLDNNVDNSSSFLPTEKPNHPLLGFKKGTNSSWNQPGPHPPREVVLRILQTLSQLSSSNQKIFDSLFIREKKEEDPNAIVIKDAEEKEEEEPFPICKIFNLLGDNYLIQNSKILEQILQLIVSILAPFNQYTPKINIQKDLKDELIEEGEKKEEEKKEGEGEGEGEAEKKEDEEEKEKEGEEKEEEKEEGKKKEEKEEKKKEKKKKEKKNCPYIPIEYLKHLPNSLTFNCSEVASKNALTILKTVCSNEHNREKLMAELINGTLILGNQTSFWLAEIVLKLESTKSAIASAFPTISHQSQALLRFIKLIYSLDPDSLPELHSVHHSLWESLNSCMSVVNNLLEETSTNTNNNNNNQTTAPTVAPMFLLPIVESYFLVCSHTLHDRDLDISLSDSMSSLRDSFKHDEEKDEEFHTFIKNYRRILNTFLRQNPSILNDSLSILTEYPSLLDFDIKRSYFRQKLHNTEGDRYRYDTIHINIRRDRLFEDSYHQIKPRTAEELKGKLTVQYAGEPGIDAGGLLKDWYQELSKEIFNPNYALFTPSADGAFQPNKDSHWNPQHLDYFEFCGRVIGKAIYDGCNMDVHFTRSFYKHILGKKVVWTDMEAVDPEYFKNLKWMLDNDISDMDLTFSAELYSFGQTKQVDLIPDGASILVSESNKKEYIQLISQLKMTASIEKQIQSFLKGLYELVPKKLISIFNELEIELLISGLPDIDVEDMRANTEYTGYKPDSKIIQSFWKIVKSYSNEERALLLQFITGSSKVPLDGFVALQGMGGPQKLHITRVPDPDRLPTAHTCFNQLDLPDYGSEEELEQKLIIAIKETTGFGFG